MKPNCSSPSGQHRQLPRRSRKSALPNLLFLILSGLLLTSCASETPTDPVSIVQVAYDRLNHGDFDGYSQLLADDVLIVDRTGRWEGADVVRTDLERSFDPQRTRFEPSGMSSDGNIVTYTLKVFEQDQLAYTYDAFVDIVADGKIIFEGPQYLLLQECETDSSQAFCPSS